MKYIKVDWPAPTNIKAYTTLRTGWHGRAQQEMRQPDETEQLKTLLDLPADPIWIKQTHSAIAIEALPENKYKEADATFSNQPNHICTIVTADCLPILICNKQGTQVAAIHAGWRGLAANIIENTINAINQPPNDLLVWLGPAIGPEKFEVGKDVYDAFVSKHADSSKAFIPHAEGKWLANLYALAKIRLATQGITQIYGSNYCTYTQKDWFFSYRRDQGITGRMASLIWIAI